MLHWTVLALAASPLVHSIVVACDEDGVAGWRRTLPTPDGLRVEVIAGAGCRALSVRNGVRRLLEIDHAPLVGIHDGARPGVTPGLIARLVERVQAPDAPAGAIPGLNSADTLKEVEPDAERYVSRTLDRATIYRVQTPQVFRREVIEAAYGQEDETLRAATDDAALVEALGGAVALVPGEEENFKVTTLQDLLAMERVLMGRAPAEVGR